jgi:hypothetical protein
MIMKKLIVVAIAAMLTFSNASAAVKCVPAPNGLCCWDVETEGPWRPITC